MTTNRQKIGIVAGWSLADGLHVEPKPGGRKTIPQKNRHGQKMLEIEKARA